MAFEVCDLGTVSLRAETELPSKHSTKQLATVSTQCEPLHFLEAEAQSYETNDDCAQTETQPIPTSATVDEAKLIKFVRGVEVSISRMLLRNAQTDFFGSWMASYDTDSETPLDTRTMEFELLYSLKHEVIAQPKLRVNNVTWSCRGLKLAASFLYFEGDTVTGDASQFKSFVAIWSLLLKSQVSLDKADLVIHADGSVKTLRHHPTIANHLFAGLSDGSLILWDTDNQQKPLLAKSFVSAQHQNQVNAISFISDTKIASTGDDGYVIVWDVDVTLGQFQLHKKFRITDSELNSSVTLPVISLAVLNKQELICGLYNGKLQRWTIPTVDNDILKPFVYSSSIYPLKSAHIGPVNSVYSVASNHCASVGTDGFIKIWNQTEKTPLLQLQPLSVGTSFTSAAQGSDILAFGTSDGLIFIFCTDSKDAVPLKEVTPVTLKLPSADLAFPSKKINFLEMNYEFNVKHQPTSGGGSMSDRSVTSLSMSPHRNPYVAASDADGYIHVWKVK